MLTTQQDSTQTTRTRARHPVAPPLARTPMAPSGWPPHSRWTRRGRRNAPGSRPERRPIAAWVAPARRLVLVALVLAQTCVATRIMASSLPYHGTHLIESASLALFAILFAWVSAGFWTALSGFFVLARGGDHWAISARADTESRPDASARTALVMPICNEHVARVFAGLRATIESIERADVDALFDLYILSDSSDADLRVAEIAAWRSLRADVGGRVKVFYRWRRHRTKRKSGNISDFCRRWGSAYRYLVVLDADSVMSGTCLTRLVQMMEANPGVGIIQTAPVAAGSDTGFARMRQFANRLYGPLFAAGLHFWQLGESHYFGHNAIVRVAPFMRHCGLGSMPGRGALAGEVLSHDFVEAALMRRAGWGVWLAYDLPGSYEELPSSLEEELKRDQRWCLGNLINLRLLGATSLHPAHRAVFATGALAYLSSALWLGFLVLATIEGVRRAIVVPRYFVQPFQLFPVWPQWHPDWALGLAAATFLILLLPKVLAMILALREGAQNYGGRARLALSVALEMVLSTILAPIHMMFHTRFVLAPLMGRRSGWRSPKRLDSETGWREALATHGVHTLIAALWAALVISVNPHALWWLLPIIGALLIAAPVSVLLSQVAAGRRARRWGVFAIPEEFTVPEELAATARYTTVETAAPGFVDAVTNRQVHRAIADAAPRRAPASGAAARAAALVDRAATLGPSALPVADKMRLIDDALSLARLRRRVRARTTVHPDWPQAGHPADEQLAAA